MTQPTIPHGKNAMAVILRGCNLWEFDNQFLPSTCSWDGLKSFNQGKMVIVIHGWMVIHAEFRGKMRVFALLKGARSKMIYPLF